MKMLKTIIGAAALAFAAGLTVGNVSAQENITGDLFAGWAVNPLPASGGTTPVPPTVSDGNLTIGPLTKGSGITAVTTTGVFGGAGWTNTGVQGSEASSIAHGLYITYSVKANPGYTISFTTNVLFYHNSATGPTVGELQYSSDGVTYTDVLPLIYSAPGIPNTSNLVMNLSGVAALQNVGSSVTNFFRIVNWGATGSAGTWYVNNASPVTMPDLQVIGTISSAGVAPFDLVVNPTAVSTNAGATVAFTVTSQGDTAIDYWYKVVGSSTNLIPTATTSTLTLANVTGADAADYFVVLSNATGTAMSPMVSLAVDDPFIVNEPNSAFGLLDGTVQFSVATAGTSPNYQWYFSDSSGNILSPVLNGTQASGSVAMNANSSTLTINNLQPTDTANFVVVVTNVYGSVTSSVASLMSVGTSATLAFWNFNQLNFPANVNSPYPWFGVGTALPVGSCNDPGTSPFAGSTDPADGPGFGLGLTNFSWGTDNYPASGSNKLNGVQFNVSTVGAKNISVSYDSRVSATASDYERLQYTTDGVTWIDYPSSSSFNGVGTTYEPYGYSLAGFPGVANNPNFGIRIVTEFQSTATYGVGVNGSIVSNYVGTANNYGTSGTVTYDIVNISGDAITNNNTPPTISSFPNVTIPDFTNATFDFTVGDAETPADQLAVTAVSLNPRVNPTFTFGGSGTSRTLNIQPNTIPDAVDATPIEVTVTDGSGDIAVTWFLLTSTSVNLPPTNSLTSITSTNTLANKPVSIQFKVGDDRTPVSGLTYTVASDNNTVISNANIVVSNQGTTNPVVTFIPNTNQLGLATVSVTVNDNDVLEPRSTTASLAFLVRPNSNVVAIDYFDYDNPGSLDSVAANFWKHLSGNFGQMQVGGGAVAVDTVDNTENLQTALLGAAYKTNSGGVLYASYIINMDPTLDPTKMPTGNGTYFTVFNDGSGVTGNYECRVVAATNGAVPGFYRIGINNFGADSTTGEMFPQDLSPNSNYVVVTSLVLSNGFSTVWINPTSLTSSSVTDTTPAPAQTNLFNISDFELRESGADGGLIQVSKLKVGTSFDSVFPSVHVQQGSNANVVVNWSDPTLSIQAANNVNGPYVDVTNATPPYTNSTVPNQTMFFRFGQ
jgi:Immunoglobulin I-set domain